MITQDGVMRHVAVLHQKIVRADDRVFSGFARTMDCNVFAESIVAADPQTSQFVLIM
jgi:hypothetical protein